MAILYHWHHHLLGHGGSGTANVFVFFLYLNELENSHKIYFFIFVFSDVGNNPVAALNCVVGKCDPDYNSFD